MCKKHLNLALRHLDCFDFIVYSLKSLSCKVTNSKSRLSSKSFAWEKGDTTLMMREDYLSRSIASWTLAGTFGINFDKA